MKVGKKFGLYLAFVFVLQIFLTPFTTLGADRYNASISQIVRESVIITETGSTEEIEYTLYGNSEFYTPTFREIVLVLDVSGSMEERMGRSTRIEVLKKAVNNFVDQYKGENVAINIVQYSNSADNVSGFYRMNNSSDVSKIRQTIASMYPNGATNIGDGMRRGYYELANSPNKDANKFMLVMTDGAPQGFTTYNKSLTDYKLDSGDTGITQKTPFETYRRSLGWLSYEEYFMYKGRNNITVLAETTGENNRPYSLEYAKKIGTMIKDNKNIKPFFIGFSDDANLDYLNKIAVSANAEAVVASRIYYDAKSEEELNQAFNEVKAKMLDEYQFKNVKYEEIIPVGVNVGDLPEGFSYNEKSRKITGTLSASMRKNPQTNRYDFICEPLKIPYEFLEEGEYLFNNGKLIYTDPFGNNGQAEVNDMRVIVKGKLYSQISIEVRDGDRTVGSSPFVTDDSKPDRKKKILSESEKLKAKEGATAIINISGNDVVSGQYAFINDHNEQNINWLPLDATMELVNPSDMLDTEGLKSRYYYVNHMPTLQDTARWSDRSEVFKYPKDEIIIRSGLLETSKRNPTGYDRIGSNLFFGYVGAQGVDYKEAAKFWGYIVPDRTGDFYFAIQSDDGNYAYIIVGGEKIEITDYFIDTAPKLIYTNNKVSLKKGVAYPIYMEYFNWGGEGEFQMFMKDTPWNDNESFMEELELYQNKVIKESEQNKYRVPNSWFRATSNNTPGEEAEATFEAEKGIPFPKESGKYYVAARSENKKGHAREAIYGAFIVDNTPPEVALLGDNPMEVFRGIPYEEPGYSARDFDYDLGDFVDIDQEEIKVEIKINGKIVDKLDTNVVGTYIITYTAEDEFGNVGMATREVIVSEGISLPKAIYIQKGSQKDLKASLNPSTLKVNWGTENKGIISLGSSMNNPVAVKGEKVGKEVITATIDGSTKSASTIAYVVNLEPSGEDGIMLKGDTMAADSLFTSNLPGDLTGTSIEYSTSGVITYNKTGGHIKANDKGAGVLTATMTIYDEELGEKIEIATANVTIHVLTVEKSSNKGYVYPDYATINIDFVVSDGDNSTNIKSEKDIILKINPQISDIASSYKIKNVTGALSFKDSDKTITIRTKGEGEYKLVIFLELKTRPGLTMEQYKEWLNNSTSINITNKFYSTSGSSSFADFNDNINIGTIPNIK